MMNTFSSKHLSYNLRPSTYSFNQIHLLSAQGGLHVSSLSEIYKNISYVFKSCIFQLNQKEIYNILRSTTSGNQMDFLISNDFYQQKTVFTYLSQINRNHWKYLEIRKITKNHYHEKSLRILEIIEKQRN